MFGAAIIVLISLNTVLPVYSMDIREETKKKNNEMCKKLAEDPYFETELVIGRQWRIYYTWNVKLDTKCLDMTFKNATPQVIQRIWNDMNEYIEHQPAWDAATLHVTMGMARHELLLFADQGAAGSFLGVPNVIRDGNISPMKQSVPLMKFQLKLVREGKYLVMMDCHIGVSTLSARSSEPIYRSEVLATVAPLQLGDGFPACTEEKNKNEMFLTK
ncbi:hypothetical protein evm_005112 [Chilo suppressalis]|nr:hypothetical protein evm_005112 [Chilo suppressalis]